jgi:hypothetical protein
MSVVHDRSKIISLDDESFRSELLGIASKMDDVIPLGRGDPDFHTPKHIVEAAKKALDDNKHHYTPPSGLPELRNAISKNFKDKYNLDYKRDVVDALPSTKEKKYNFAEFEIDGEVLNEQPSQRITQIGSAGVFNTGLGSYKSYNEEKDDTDYGKKVIGNVMKAHLLKAPITIKVSGVGFLKPKTNMTLGNTVRIYFMANKPAHAKSTNNWDIKRSGDYLIYATKHSFTTERYDISLTCAKMKNFTSEAAIV